MSKIRIGKMVKKDQSKKDVPQDHKQTVSWYRKEAHQGDREAQFHLGVMYEKGEGVTQSYKQALYWYEKAAKQGYVAAQFNLGVIYYQSEDQEIKKL